MKKKAVLLVLMTILASGALYSIDLADVRSNYMDAVQCLANNNLLDAEKVFNWVISVPDSRGTFDKYKAKSYYFMGDIYFIRQNYDKAIDFYRVVVQKYQSQDVYARTLYKLGRTLVMVSRYDEAIAILNDYVARYDNTDNLGDNSLYWIGRAYVGKKEFNAALVTYQSILNNYPDTALAYDIRNSIASLTKLVEEEERQRQLRLYFGTNDMQGLKNKSEQLGRDKEMLDKISRLLLIKQRLLEIKSEKIRILEKIKESKEM